MNLKPRGKKNSFLDVKPICQHIQKKHMPIAYASIILVGFSQFLISNIIDIWGGGLQFWV